MPLNPGDDSVRPRRAARAKGLCALLLAVTAVRAADPIYETEIRPIIKAHCTHCHGEEPDPEGGVDLRLRRFMDGKTEEGAPVLTPGHPDKSALITVIREGKMPKKGKKLTKQELDLLERWVSAGAKTNAAEPEPEKLPPGPYITAADRRFWAFQPVKAAPVPKFKDAPDLAPIDAFIRAKLLAAGLDFAPEADRATLIRRVTLDLTGLPPTPEETAAFLADTRPAAYAELVERLLASPAYGERWARHWLDVAGYADTNGYADIDSVRPHAWRYRDYVIRSLNADKPWDRFIQEQLAGDELMKVDAGTVAAAVLDPAKVDALAATGFLRLAPDGTGDVVPDPALARNQNIADTVRVVSTSLLGLTVACAQCHDHRYEPITQVDYYRLRAIFDPALDWRKWRTPAQFTASLYTAADRAKAAEIEKQAAAIDAEANKMQKDFLDAIFEKKILEVPEAERAAYRAARALPQAKRSKEQAALLKKYFSAQALFGLDLYDKKADAQVKAKRAEAAALRATKPAEGRLTVVTEAIGALPKSELHHRGDHTQLRQEVAPAELPILGTPSLAKTDATLATSGRRLAYARWLTSGQHPLVGRTLMNRVWLNHFGRGIVNTPGDLGHLGDRPTHPELLDYLADRFVKSGWSLKAMHREMLASRAYRQSSRNDDATARDPDNALYGRFRVRRLDAETLRDSMLAVSGKLNRAMYGAPVTIAKTGDGRMIPGVEIKNVNGDVTKVDNSSPDVRRRSLYLQMRRNGPATALATFDLPIMEPNCEVRNCSTVATQSLFLMNDEFVLTAAHDLAEKILQESPGDKVRQAGQAWLLTQGRAPTVKETEQFLSLLREQTDHFIALAPKTAPAKAAAAKTVAKPDAKAPAAKPAPPAPAEATPAYNPHLEAFSSLCQALLVSNRFLYVD